MKTLIWSVAWGDYRYMLQSLVYSMRNCGINHDILVYCDEPLHGCISKRMDPSIHLDQTQYWKFDYLQKVASMDYDVLVFIDSDHYFVRKPNQDFYEMLAGDKWHSFLESPLNSDDTKRADWWGAKNKDMTTLWRAFGVGQNIVYNTNGGFWICKKEFAKAAKDTVPAFKEIQARANYNFPEEVGIAVLSHMFSKDYSARFHSNHMDTWASEWTGVMRDKVPDGNPWKFIEYMTHKDSMVNPAIVHAMRSKTALVNLGKQIMQDNKDRSYQ